MDLLEDLRMSLLNFGSVMIYIIHKMLVLLKIHLNYLKDSIFEFFSQHIMMESLSLEEWNIIKDIRNLFRQGKETNAIKDIKNHFEHEEEEENYYEPVRVSNFWSNNYIKYNSNGDRNKTQSVWEYLNEIRPYLKDIINKLKKSDRWKVQLTIANNVISSIDNDEERVIHSKCSNIEIMVNDEADEVIK